MLNLLAFGCVAQHTILEIPEQVRNDRLFKIFYARLTLNNPKAGSIPRMLIQC